MKKINKSQFQDVDPHPSKTPDDFDQLRNMLPVHQVIEFDGTLPDLMLKLSCQDGGDVTLVRGMRDQNDLIYENNLKQIYRDMGMRNDIMYFMTQYPHVSSTVIRTMTT